jgi:hypothetical protein
MQILYEETRNLKWIQNNIQQLDCVTWVHRMFQIRIELQDSFVLLISILGFLLLVCAGVSQYIISSVDSCF